VLDEVAMGKTSLRVLQFFTSHYHFTDVPYSYFIHLPPTPRTQLASLNKQLRFCSSISYCHCVTGGHFP
jgi:hypothetical protein